MNVYDAIQKRLSIIFNEFDNIYISFSGGKDSGVLLNLCIQYMKKHGINKKIGVFHQDFEAQYTLTTEFVTRMMLDHQNLVNPYWICIPMSVNSSASQFEQYWITWDKDKKDKWCRDMPDYDCVINLENHQFDFYQLNMHQEEIYKNFGAWYHKKCGGKGKTVGLVGIRTQESLNRWRAINQDKNTYKNYKWTTHNPDGTYTAHPIYDWTSEDIWVANAKFEFDYNKLYDQYYYSGLDINQMRVASPFSSSALQGLNLYRVIEPKMWTKLIERVNGANFASLYASSKMMAWKNIELPKGHTWKSFVEFLLGTLPKEIREGYQEKFATSIKFWRDKGGVISDETLKELSDLGIKFELATTPNKYKTTKQAVTFEEYPDNANVSEFASVPTYKRMAICILKNDHTCKYMGFGQTKEQLNKRKAALEKYQDL